MFKQFFKFSKVLNISDKIQGFFFYKNGVNIWKNWISVLWGKTYSKQHFLKKEKRKNFLRMLLKTVFRIYFALFLVYSLARLLPPSIHSHCTRIERCGNIGIFVIVSLRVEYIDISIYRCLDIKIHWCEISVDRQRHLTVACKMLTMWNYFDRIERIRCQVEFIKIDVIRCTKSTWNVLGVKYIEKI